MPAVRTPDWQPRAGAHWERWSLNGDVIITGLVPPLPGGARLAHCLTWVLREFASRCRRTYDGTGVLAFTCAGPRTPSTLAQALSLWFDLALHDPRLVRERARSRGGDPDACRWPALWLEGATFEYILPGARLHRGRAPRQKLLVLAEERQVRVAARSLDVSTRVTRAWSDGLDAGTREEVSAAHGQEWLLRPPQITISCMREALLPVQTVSQQTTLPAGRTELQYVTWSCMKSRVPCHRDVHLRGTTGIHSTQQQRYNTRFRRSGRAAHSRSAPVSRRGMLVQYVAASTGRTRESKRCASSTRSIAKCRCLPACSRSGCAAIGRSGTYRLASHRATMARAMNPWSNGMTDDETFPRFDDWA